MISSALLGGAVAAIALLAAMPAMAAGNALLPKNFFSNLPSTGNGPAQVEANTLSFDADTGVITAEGDVQLSQGGFVARGERVVYNMKTGAVAFAGPVKVTDPGGTVYTAVDPEITGGMKEAFLKSLTITTPKGSVISAADVRFSSELETVLTNASYSPCGDCIDDKGRRIGWRVKAARITINNDTHTIYLEQPQLEILGIPVAWLPFFSFPDPTQTRRNGFRFPAVDYNDKFGVKLSVPYFVGWGKDTDILLTPRLFSRQGVMLDGSLVQRFKQGTASVRATGIYQLDPAAFGNGLGGDETWRGSFQTSGRFTPVENWTTGWSYTAFTDTAYLKDYRIANSDNKVNQVYATHFDPDSFYADFRLQQFLFLGDNGDKAAARQAVAIPNAEASQVFNLGNGYGQVKLEGTLLGVQRDLDDSPIVGGHRYVYGYAERKVHAMAMASWQDQWVGPGGIVATPYAGLRADAATYDGASDLLPEQRSLFSLTPIAAMDVRWPLAIRGTGAVQIVEPIAQVVYRGADTSVAGITNDDAQSFVFDDTNLFSYNRFTGSDRQETGLRANLGGRYQLDFGGGSWMEVLAGQSFQLAGTNAFTVNDGTNLNVGSGLQTDASYAVLGVKGSLFGLVNGAAKLIVDPNDAEVTRAVAAVQLQNQEGYSLGLTYAYLAGDEKPGVTEPQHEVGALASAPLFDYWRVNAGLSWDLDANTWLEARAGLQYDDGYLAVGANYIMTGPTNDKPDDKRFIAKFALKGPEGTAFSY